MQGSEVREILPPFPYEITRKVFNVKPEKIFDLG